MAGAGADAGIPDTYVARYTARAAPACSCSSLHLIAPCHGRGQTVHRIPPSSRTLASAAPESRETGQCMGFRWLSRPRQLAGPIPGNRPTALHCTDSARAVGILPSSSRRSCLCQVATPCMRDACAQPSIVGCSLH